jgi:hypothetical protein
MGIRDKPIAPASSCQNGFAERLIGSLRRERLDHIIVLGGEHLRRILKNYAAYYNGVRTHRSLQKEAPVSRPVQRSGAIIRTPSWADFIINTFGFSFRYTQGLSPPILCQLSWRTLSWVRLGPSGISGAGLLNPG